MNSQDRISVVVVDDTDESREMILRMLQFDTSIDVIGTARTGVEAVEVAQKLKPDVMVMDINMPDMDGISATEAIRKKIPFIQIIILSVQNDANYMRRAMLAGARDFLTKPPLIDDLTIAVRRAGELAHEEKTKTVVPFQTAGLTGPLPPGIAMPLVLGKIIVVYSPKGGSGCTTVATNIATALKTADNKVALVDANLLYGDVAVFLNEHGKNSFLDLIDHANDLDYEIIQDVMITNKTTNLQLMTAPKDAELEDRGKGEPVSKILTFMQQIYQYIIVDTTSYLTEIVQTCLDIADFIILITTQDIPSIKNSNQFLTIADASGISRDRILFVLNKYDRRIPISPERVGETLKQPVLATIPFEDRVISNSINRGIPFILENKNLPSSKAIQSLIQIIQDKCTQHNED